MDIKAILQNRYHNSQWLLHGNLYAGLIWLDNSPKPLESDLLAAWPQVQYDVEYKAVEKARHVAYVTDSDPLFFEWQRGDATEQEWRDAVQAVKTAHPYPTPPWK